MKNIRQTVCAGVMRCAAAAVVLGLASPAAAVTATWDGGSLVNASWRTTTNWVSDVVPTFNNTLDVSFYNVGAGNLSCFLGTASAIRSLNFTADADSAVSIRLANTLSGNIARDLTIGGAGGAAITSDADAAGNFTVGVGGTGSQLILLENLAITHNGTGSLTINRPIVGGYGLTCTGSGLVTLSAANTYSNATSVSGGGAVIIAADSGLGTPPASATPGHLTLSGGGLASTATAALSANRGVALDGVGGQFNVNAGTLTVGGIVAGAGGLEKAGAGALALTNANTYSGGTLLSAGKLNVNHANALGTGVFSIKGGTVNNTSGAAVTVTNSVVIDGDFSTDNNQVSEQVTFSAQGITLGTATGSSRAITATAAGTSGLTFSGSIVAGVTATGIVKLGPGGIVLSGTSTFSGGVVLGEGVLSVNSSSTGSAGALGTGTLTISNATVLSTGGVNARTISNAVSVAGNFELGSGLGNAALTMAGPMDLNGGTRVITVVNTNGGDIIAGEISNGALTVGAGDGVLTLSGNNTYAGDTTLNNTAKLSVGSDANLGTGTNVTLSQNSVLTAAGNITSGKRFTLVGLGQSILVNSGKTVILNGVVGGTGQSPTKSGPGTLVLNATNEFADTSILLVKDGTLKLGNAYALKGTTLKFNPAGSFLDNSSGAAMTVAGYLGLELTSGFTFTGTDDLDLSAMPASFVQTANTTRTLNVSAKTLTIGGILATGTDYAGAARVSGALNKTGNGTLVLAGASSYSNGTTVAAGTLRLAADNALPPGGDVTLAGGTLDMGEFASSPSSLNMTANSALVLGSGQLAFTSQTNLWSGRLALSGELGRYTLRFQPALTAEQLSSIDYLLGNRFYSSSDGYLRTYPKGTIISVY